MNFPKRLKPFQIMPGFKGVWERGISGISQAFSCRFARFLPRRHLHARGFAPVVYTVYVAAETGAFSAKTTPTPPFSFARASHALQCAPASTVLGSSPRACVESVSVGLGALGSAPAPCMLVGRVMFTHVNCPQLCGRIAWGVGALESPCSAHLRVSSWCVSD